MTRSSSASGGELCSALGSAAGKNLAAIGGRHSLAEAMLLLGLELLGLIGTFHPLLHSFRIIILNIRSGGTEAVDKNLPTAIKAVGRLLYTTFQFNVNNDFHAPAEAFLGRAAPVRSSPLMYVPSGLYSSAPTTMHSAISTAIKLPL